MSWDGIVRAYQIACLVVIGAVIAIALYAWRSSR